MSSGDGRDGRGGAACRRRAGGPRRLSTTIFTTLLAATAAVVVVVALAMMVAFYASHERRASDLLLARARATAEAVDGLPRSEAAAVLGAQTDRGVRETLVAPDGEVLFDSGPLGPGVGPNHADRPEIQAAETNGEGVVTRFSQTLHEDTLYAAVRLADGYVVRLSETRESFLAFAGSLLPPAGLGLAVGTVVVLGASRLLTERIVRPLHAIDVAEPLACAPYAEMVPLLERIDDQRVQLEEQNRELARAEGLRRDFSANVSHEMKTPLQVIAGYAELMREGMVPPEDVRRFAGVIHDEALSMRGLINDVLTLSRLDEPVDRAATRRPVDLLAVAERCAARIEPVAEGRRVAGVVVGDPAVVNGDETLLEEMVANLVSNAVRYNREGGSVYVEVRAEAGRATVRVSDTGPGIPQEEQQKIFERFYRMERSRSKETGGTGLGLAIVKHVVQRHGGTVEVQSALGEGTTFTVQLPRG